MSEITHFAQLSPYLYPASSSSTASGGIELNGNMNNEANFFLHRHHHQDLLSHYLGAVAPSMETAGASNKTMMTITNNSNCSSKKIITNCRRKQAAAMKRDRHTKICTAQGPRDRRVRLSMDIARKFFGLQDLLGYEKASQTLDWLFTNSKPAIRQLFETTFKLDTTSTAGRLHDANAKCLCFWSEAAVVNHNNFVNVAAAAGTNMTKEDHELKNAASKTKPPKKKTHQVAGKNPKLVALSKLVKESRAKARTRARERTREKAVSLRKLTSTTHVDSVDHKLPDLCGPDQSKPAAAAANWSQLVATSSKTKEDSNLNESTQFDQDNGFFCFNDQDSQRIKRKVVKPGSSSVQGFQRNQLLLSGSEAENPNFHRWSITPIITNGTWGISSLCAVTNTTGTSTTVLQVCGKPSEDKSNNF